MARSNLAAVANEDADTKRRRGKRGPMVFYVAYEIVDQSGSPVEGYKAKFIKVEKDKESITRRVLNGEKIDNLMVVTVPLNNQGEADTSQASAQAEAA